MHKKWHAKWDGLCIQTKANLSAQKIRQASLTKNQMGFCHVKWGGLGTQKKTACKMRRTPRGQIEAGSAHKKRDNLLCTRNEAGSCTKNSTHKTRWARRTKNKAQKTRQASAMQNEASLAHEENWHAKWGILCMKNEAGWCTQSDDRITSKGLAIFSLTTTQNIF